MKFLTSSNYDKEITESKTPVIVDFYADWCMPCRMMSPVFESLSKEYEGKLKFIKLDTEAEMDLASKFEVQGIPSLIILNKGKEVERIVGFAPKPLLKQKIDSALSNI